MDIARLFRPLGQRLPVLQQIEREHSDLRHTLLAEWEDLKAKEFRRLDRVAEDVNRKLAGQVQVVLAAAGDQELLFEMLRREIGGRLSNVVSAIK